MTTIAELRRRKNWTQQDLADRLGVTRVTVARWETGQRAPDRFTLRALAQTFGVKATDIEAQTLQPARPRKPPAE